MENVEQNLDKNKVHKTLVHSYSAYFLLFIIGVYLDLVFNLKVFENSIIIPVGFVILVLGTLLIIWAQETSRNLKIENISKETFSHGPYCFTRTPTNFGLFFLMLGFGMVSNALFTIFLSFVAFVIAKFIFLKKEEKFLSEKYGTPYLEYKASVKF
jgi:protein-S-isoprenylcysteine O-methyltransferase Ste14